MHVPALAKNEKLLGETSEQLSALFEKIVAQQKERMLNETKTAVDMALQRSLLGNNSNF